MLERRVAYLEDKLNEKLNKYKTVVSCEVSKPIEKLVSSIIEWEKPEPIKEPEPEPIKESDYNININETKRLLALLEKPRGKMITRYNKKGVKLVNSWTGPGRPWCRFIYYKVNDEIEKFNKETLKKTYLEEDIDEDINLEEYSTDDEEGQQYFKTTSLEKKEILSDNIIDMTKPITEVNEDKLGKFTLRDSDTNKIQQFYKYIIVEKNKEDKIIILNKNKQKVGVCKFWIDKNIDEDFRDEEGIINFEGEDLREILITVPELTRLDKQLFREFKYNAHYNNLTETNEYFEDWLSKEEIFKFLDSNKIDVKNI